jgi:hypothetical protein
VPMGTSKSPRPTEESNLDEVRMRSCSRPESIDLLLALLAILGDPTSVLHGDVVAVLGVGRAVALLDDLLGDTHVD